MARFLVSRALQALVSILGVSTIIFVVMHLSGDPTLLLVPEGASREDVELLRHQLGFDRPLAVQYADYLAGLARGDLGTSLVQRRCGSSDRCGGPAAWGGCAGGVFRSVTTSASSRRSGTALNVTRTDW